MKRLWRSLILLRIRPARGATPELRAWLARAGRGGPFARHFWLLLGAVFSLGMFVALGYLSAIWVHRYLWESTPASFDEVYEDLVADTWIPYALGWAIAAILTAALLIPLRLVWLHLGVRRALRHRDRCIHCGHGLAGVPLSPSQEVTCAECGRATPAVPAWGEIDAANPDRTVFTPAHDLIRVFWTRRRIILSARITAAALALAAITYGTWWSAREIRIRSQAALARKERPGEEAINAKFFASVPKSRSGEPRVIDIARRVTDEYHRISENFRTLHKGALTNDANFNPDASYLQYSLLRRAKPEDLETAVNVRYSIQLMQQARQLGLYDLIDELPSASRWSDQRYLPVDNQNPPPGYLGTLRATYRICAARLHIAFAAGDLDELRRTLRAANSIVETARQGPMLIDWLVAESIDSGITTELVGILITSPSSPWVETIAREYPALSSVPAERLIEAERLATLDSIAWYFSDPSRVRRGLTAPELADNLGIGGPLDVSKLLSDEEDSEQAPTLRLGSYTENRDAFEEAYTQAGRHMRLLPFQRKPAKPTRTATSDLVIPHHWGSIFRVIEDNLDKAMLRQRAFRVILALEQFRIDHLAYPDTLDQLLLDLPADALVDPWSGRPFGYRKIDRTTDALGRGYLLWTVGFDGIDQGGVSDEYPGAKALRPNGAGLDLILNDPAW